MTELSTKVRYVFDIEANGLLNDNPDVIWIAVVEDLATGKRWSYSDYDEDSFPLKKLPKRLSKADELIGHNIIGYDLIVLERLLGWTSPPEQKKVDTLLMSQSLDQRRFNYDGHSLDRWGEFLKIKKVEISDEQWHTWDPSFIKRCNTDVDINEKIYNYLLVELREKAKVQPTQRTMLAAEHYAAEFSARAQEDGWPFNRKEAVKLLEQMESELKAYERKYEPQMPPVIKRKGPKDKIYTPVYKKNGEFNHHTCRYFDLDPKEAFNDKCILTPKVPFSLIDIKPSKLSSSENIKAWITKLGWEPLQWNTKRLETGELINTSPKLCEESLAAIGQVGIDINDYNSTSSRASILRGWLAILDSNDRLHGDSRIIGTPTFRFRHKIIANIPSKDAKWGSEIRKLFTVEPGWIMVGADSSGNQARGLCHYVDDPDFTKRYLAEDLHDQNANVLKCERSIAKRFLYAYLFGASDSKLGLYLTGRPNKKEGAKARKTFEKSLPGLDELIEKLNAIYEKTKGQVRNQNPDNEYNQGYIPDLAGRRVYSDSPHKLLNYLLQSAEAVTCKAALMYGIQKLREENIEYQPLIMYHDEYQILVKPNDSKRAAEIMEEGFKVAPTWFGVTIMDGKADIGENWLECH